MCILDYAVFDGDIIGINDGNIVSSAVFDGTAGDGDVISHKELLLAVKLIMPRQFEDGE